MSFKNFLDLRKKSPQQVQVVERIVFQKRSLKSDLFLTLTVIFVASGIIWGISKADTVVQMVKPVVQNQDAFSTSGIVSFVSPEVITIDFAKNLTRFFHLNNYICERTKEIVEEKN